MTEGETLFYLREIHSHWCTSNVSAEKLNELEAARLIEINGAPIQAVRLTSEGARRKTLGRPPGMTNGISLKRKAKNFRPQQRRKANLPAKRLV